MNSIMLLGTTNDLIALFKTKVLRQIPFVLMALLCLIFFQNCNYNPTSSTGNQILNERIAVLPFQNNTNDAQLEILGIMAADWINTGLMNISEVEVVSSFTVQTNIESIGILENDSEGRPSFAELTGAKNLITGRYYKEGEDLIFKLEILDAFNGKLHFSFDEIRGKAANKEALIIKLRDEITAYWAARDMVDAKKISPPKLEAYELYLNSINRRYRASIHQRIINLDTSFYLARINFLNQNVAGSHGNNKAHFDFLKRHISNLSDYEKGWYDYLKGLFLGDMEKAFNSLNALRIKYPKDFILNYNTASLALRGLNNPELSLTILGELPIEKSHIEKLAFYYNQRLVDEYTALVKLGKEEEADTFFERFSPIRSGPGALNRWLTAILWDALRRKDKTAIEKVYSEVKDAYQNISPFQYFVTATLVEQSNWLTPDFTRQIRSDYIRFYQELSPTDPSRALFGFFVARMAKQPQKMNLEIIKKLPKTFQIVSWSAFGRLSLELKEQDKVDYAIAELEKLTTLEYEVHSSVGAGMALYLIGRLHCKMGDFDKAIDYLRRAKGLGFDSQLCYYQFDSQLEPMYELPAFKKICTEAIWPEDEDAKIIVKEMNQYLAATKKVEDRTSDFKSNNKITLASGDRFFRLKLSTSNLATNVSYQYKINGLDEEWISTDKNEITINGLPYGEQTLMVKALFPSGRFSKDVLEIPITVIKPFYLSAWFILGAIGFVLLGVRWWTYRLRMQKEILEKEVVKRTEKIEQQAEELRQLDKVKSNFFANVSHDLRTPLTLILGPLSRMLQSENLDENELRMLNTMKQSGQDLLNLTNEILALTKLESGKLVLEEEPVEIGSLLHRLVAVFESFAEKGGIMLVLECRVERDLVINLDQNKFEKIVNNLLVNALKFTPQKGQVNVLLEDVGGDLLLKVEDTGRGIHPDDLPHVFDRFFQTKRPEAAAEGGAGIGLALVREYAKLMNGKISVESELGKGSSFLFQFPKQELTTIADKDVEIAEATMVAEEEGPIQMIKREVTEVKSERRGHVLIVEDNEKIQEYISIVLGEHYEISKAGNGQEALDWLKLQTAETLPNLILSDVMMPVMDGMQFLNHLKSNEKYLGIPVVMLTAKATLQDKLSALRIGVDDYMVKPFVEDELLLRIDNLLKNAAIRKQYVPGEEEEVENLSFSNEVENQYKAEQTNTITEEDTEWLALVEQKVLDGISDFDFTLERLGGMVYLSPRQIRRRLKRITGLSFSQYLREVRFAKARRLLETQAVKSVKVLAYEVGMRDAKYFSKEFKSFYGKLPSEYL